MHYDEQTGISVYGGFIDFVFQYCQWKEIIEENDITNTILGVPELGPYTKRVWSKSQLDSSRYRDRNVHNPVDVPNFNSWKIYNDVRVENLTLNSSMFWNNLPFQYYGLSDEEIADFNQSALFEQGFFYIGSGWFYRPYRGQADLESRLAKYNSTKKLMDKCDPGDVRVRFQLFAPKMISVVGYKDGNMIRPGNYKDYMYGAVSRYDEDVQGVLSDWLERDDTSGYVIWAVPGILMTFWTYFRQRGKRVLTMFLTAFAVMAVRSILWNGGLMNPYVWCPLFVLCIPVYRWLIRNERLNNWFERM